MTDTSDLDTPRQSVGSIVQAVAILRYLADSGQATGVTAIAKALDISPSSCFNILRTLVAEGMLEFSPSDKSYRIGGGVLELAHQALAQSRVFSVLRHRLEALAGEYMITMALRRVVQGKRLIVIATAECDADTHIQIRVGHRQPLLAGACGRCIAAFSSYTREQIREKLSEVTWHTAPRIGDYSRELEEVRNRGWAIDEGRLSVGITTISAPVFGDPGTVLYSISGNMFTGQHPPATLTRIGETIRDVASRASRKVAVDDL